jgi:uncharacterized membrane protein YfcA
MDVNLAGFGLGAVVGLILALTGAGGGILAVPLLVFGLHLSITQAAPVGLIAVGAASALGAALGLREGIVRYRAAALIGVTGLLLAPLGVQLARQIPNPPLTVAFACVLGWVALRTWRQSHRGAGDHLDGALARSQLPCVVNPDAQRLTWTTPCAWALAGTGAVAGLLSGLLGVGGGFVIVPSLGHYTNLTARSIVATSLAVIALVSTGGVVASAIGGHVDWHIAAPFAGGALAGMLVGRGFAHRLAGPALQQGFAVFAGVVAIGLIVRTLA